MVLSLVNQPNDPRRGVISLVEATAAPEVDDFRSEQDAFLITGETSDPSEVRAQVPTDYQAQVRAMLDEAYLSPERQAGVDAYRLQQMQEKFSDLMGNPDLYYEAVLFAGNGEVEAIDARIATNTLIARRLNEQIETDEQNGLMDRFIDFGSYAISETFLGPIDKISDDPLSEQLGREVQNAMSTMKPSDFKSWYENDFLVRAAEKGIGRNNANYISELAAASLNSGYNPDAQLERVMSIAFDVTGIGSLAGTVGRVARGAVTSVARSASQSEIAAAAAAEIARESSAKAIPAVLGSVTPLGRVAAVEGSEAAGERAIAMIAAEAQEGGVAAREIANTGPAHLDPTLNASRPSDTAFARLSQEDTLAYRISQVLNSGAIGHVADPAIIKAQAERILATAADNIGYPILRSSAVQDVALGVWRAVLHVGDNAGVPFSLTPKLGKIPKHVQDLADELGGEVIVTKPAAGKPEVYIQVSQPLDLDDYIDALTDKDLLIKHEQVERSLIAKVGSFLMSPLRAAGETRLFANRANLSADRIQGLAELGEAGQNAIKMEFLTAAKPYTKLKALEQDRINGVLTVLRDGDAASARSWFSDVEFADKYHRMFGKDPSKEVIAGYNAIIDVSDAAYIMQASRITLKYSKLGYKTLTITPEYRVPGKLLNNTSSLKTADNIYSSDGTVYRWGDFVKDGATPKIWKLDKPIQIKNTWVEYIVKPMQVDELDPRSVLGYNPGGPRVGERAKNFIVAQTKGGRMRALLSTFSPAEADTAFREISAIRKAAAEGTLTDDVILANRTWRPQLENVKQFEEFAQRAGWKDFADSPLAKKKHDEPVNETEAGFDEANTGLGTGEYIVNDQRRMDKVLDHFGGGKKFSQDPVTNIAAQFGSASHELAFNAYTRVAMHSWVKRVRDTRPDWLPKNVSVNDTRNLFLNAKVTGDDAFANAMRRVQFTERRRMAIQSPLAESIERGKEAMTNWIFDKSKAVKKGGVIVSLNPTDALLKIGFHSALGMFNPRQALIQSTHAIAIMAMSPKHGMKGASMAMWMRSLFHADVDALELGLRRAAEHYGYTYDEMADMFELVRSSGRNIMEVDAQEIGTSLAHNLPGHGASSTSPKAYKEAWRAAQRVTGKTLDMGTLPYKAGERTSRLTGIWTAVNEWKALNPGKMIDYEGRMWISRREHTLNLNMTNTSRRMAQEGLMRVPTQWLSHSLSVFEAVFVGRNLTVAERARLAFIYGPFYGATGVGFGWAAADIAEMLGVPEDSAWYTTLKWGFIDGMMDVLLPDGDFGKVGTGLSTSLSPWGQLVELHRKFTEESVVEAAGGPSGAIATNLASAIYNTFSSIYRGDTALLQEDLIKLLRQPSSIDNIWKGVAILNNGIYTSKNGVTIPSEMSPIEGVLQMIGIGSLRSQEFYRARSQMFRDSRSLAADRKWINDRKRIAQDHMTSGDPSRAERGVEMMQELSNIIQFSGYSPANQRSLRTSLGNQTPDQMVELMRSMYAMQRNAELSHLQTVMGR